MKRVLRWLGSLQIAVPLLIAIAIVLAWGTIYEARYGTEAVQRFVYQAWWFQTLLAFLAVNLALAAFERLPWKRHHTPFLLAHLGIILILVGGIIGGRFGIQGQLIIPEGQAERVLQLPNNVLVVTQPNPGVTHVFPTHFEASAWIDKPHALFRILHEDHWVQLVVDRYYPNAVSEEQIANNGPTENPAIQLAIKDGEQEETTWLLAKDPDRFGVRWGEAHVLFLQPDSTEELAGLVGAVPQDPSSRGVVTIELPELKVEQAIPVPADFSQPIPLDGTPYVVRFKDYFTDFGITEQGVVNRSPEPNNPAIALTLTGPEGTETFLAFALHPDFAALHGQHRAIHAHVNYRHAARPAVPPNAICVFRHPSGDLSCVLTGAEGEQYAAACEPGHRYTHPWLSYQFEILAYYPKALVTTEFKNRGGEVKAEALHITAQEGSTVADGWLGLRGTLELPLGGKQPMRVEYRPDQRELPVTIKLLDFRKIDYPGTEMASAFESDVELTDTQRGIMLMRTIRMNKPLKYRGYSFYQSSFVPGPTETTILSVRNDPGTPFVYAGFLIVIFGVISMFILNAREDRAHTQESR